MALTTRLTQPRLGNTGVSSLVKSSQTLANEISTYNDTVQRITFENNPSDASLSSYLDYLGGRVNTLQATGSVSDATKALTLTQTMRSAVSRNTSFNIQNQSIQILAGNATSTDKLNYIQGAFVRAMNIGDTSLAQSLESQAYSLDQQIQYEKQVAADNAVTVNKANASAIKAGYTDALDAVKNGLQDISTQIQNGGAARVQGALNDFTKKFGTIYTQLTGEKLPAGKQVTLGSITQAYFNTEYAYNTKAAAAIQPYDAAAAQSFTQAAHDIVSGATTINIGGRAMNVYEATTWANSPNLYRFETDANGQTKLAQNAVTGYTYVNGQIVPQSNGNAGTAFGVLDKNGKNQLTNTLKGLGVNLTGSGDNLSVQLTNDSIKKLHLDGSGLKSGDQVSLIPQANGGLQFTSNGKIYNLALDSRNLIGVGMTDTNGKTTFVGGQYGFNQQANTLINNATVSQLRVQATQKIQQAAEAAQVATQQRTSSVLSAGPKLGATGSPQPGGPQMTQRAGGGFNFTYNGAAISAAKYSQLTGTEFRTLLTQMAGKGDTGAQTALGFVGNDYKFDPTKPAAYQNAGVYNSLTWGAGVPTNTGTASAKYLGNGAQLSF